MGRGADVIDVRNVGAVIDACLERPPEEELVERAEAAVRIAADEIDVHSLEVGRRIGAARELDLGPVLDMLGEPPLDAVGVGFAQRLGPACRPQGRGSRPRRRLSPSAAPRASAAKGSPRPAARGSDRAPSAGRRRSLAPPAGGRARPRSRRATRRRVRRQMHERDLGEVLFAAPARRLFERIMDLHVALAVPIGLQASPDVRRRWHGPVLEQASVELLGRRRADDTLRGGDLLAACELDAAALERRRRGRMRTTSAFARTLPPSSTMSRSNAASNFLAPPTAIGQPAPSMAKAITLAIAAE